MKMTQTSWLFDGLRYLILVFLAFMFIAQLFASLDWPVEGDTVYLHYMAYLINEHGFVPYRDLFEINMPGTYLFHIILTKLFGYSDLVLRITNMVWLASVLAVSWLILRSFGVLSAFAGSFLFALVYLGFGPSMFLERDAFAILPIAISVLLATRQKDGNSPKYIAVLHGVLFACAVLIKPQLILGLPVVLMYAVINETPLPRSFPAMIKPFVTMSLLAGLGFVATLVPPLLWVWYIGALHAFLEILFYYIPLYAQIPGSISFDGPFLDRMYLFYNYIDFGGLGTLLLASMFGVYVIATQSESSHLKRISILLLTLTAVFSISVVIGGKLWHYHWMPYMYFSSLGAAVLLFSSSSQKSGRLAVVPVLVFIVAAMSVIHLKGNVLSQLVVKPQIFLTDPRKDQITAYFKKNLSPTDKIQAMNWNLPTLMALYELRAVPATPYIVDLQFYHDLSNPYIQHLREDFMQRMAQEMPRFIILSKHKKEMLHIDGPNKFTELQAFIAKYYSLDYKAKNLQIYKRKEK